MKRRQFVLTCGASFAGITSGCMSQPIRTEFQRSNNNEYNIRIHNNADKELKVSLDIFTMEKSENITKNTYNFNIKSNNIQSVNNVFTSNFTRYKINISVNNNLWEGNINTSELNGSELKFNITDTEIRYRSEERPLTDIDIYNGTSITQKFKIQVKDVSSGSIYEDVESVPSGAIYKYINVFEIGDRYEVRVSVNSRYGSTKIRNSRTNGVSVFLQEDELDVSVGEE